MQDSITADVNRTPSPEQSTAAERSTRKKLPGPWVKELEQQPPRAVEKNIEIRRSADSMPLIATKLYIPPKRSNLVARPRLVGRLNQGLECKLTLISAPPGFGKTTVLSEWIPASPQCVCWLSLDKEDNDPIRFWTHFFAALQRLDVSLGASAHTLLKSAQGIPLESIVPLLVNDLGAFRDSFAFVLDDYHLIETQAIHDSVSFLLDHLPSNVHLIITSRADPPLPLAHLRARGELVELRAADLRFTLDEATTLLNQVMAFNLTAPDIAALEARTEGWIAGLQLAALSMRERDDRAGFIAAFAGSHRFILDYLVEQVLERLSPGIQSFLLETSILDRFTAPLCDAVRRADDSRRILEQMERANVFLISLDDERQWYRYHHLFADVLRVRERERDGGPHVAELHRRASVWYEENGLLVDAMHHALATQDYEHCMTMIEKNYESLWRQGQCLTINRWFDSIPLNVLSANVELMLARAYSLFLFDPFRMQESERALRDAENALAAQTSPSQRTLNASDKAHGILATIHAALASMRDEIPQTIAFSRQALALLPAECAFWRIAALFFMGYSYEVSGDSAQAKPALQEVITLAPRDGHPVDAISALFHLARMHVLLGKLEAAKINYDQAIEIAHRYGLDREASTGAVYIGLGKVLYERNDLAPAKRFISDGIALLSHEIGEQSLLQMDGYVFLARICILQKEQDCIAEIAPWLSQPRHIGDMPRIHLLVKVYQSQFYLRLNEIDRLRELRVELEALINGQLEPYREFSQIVLARIAIADRQYEKALQLLDMLQNHVQDRQGRLIEILVLRALALDAARDRSGAMDALTRALSLAEPEGYIRVFVDEGEPMRPLISDFTRSVQISDSRLQAYAKKLLDAFGTRQDIPSSSSATQRLIEPLSARELEVLRFIADGASNQEIADKLVISIATVKRHISNIYGKLQVTSRTQAIAQARELRII